MKNQRTRIEFSREIKHRKMNSIQSGFTWMVVEEEAKNHQQLQACLELLQSKVPVNVELGRTVFRQFDFCFPNENGWDVFNLDTHSAEFMATLIFDLTAWKCALSDEVLIE